MAIPNIVPRGNNDGETLGTQNKKWSNVHTVDVNLNGVSLTTKLAGIDSKNTTQDSKISTLEGNVSTLSSNKADKTNVYTKAEINNSLATKADATTTASALASKANAADVYTKTETDSALNSLSAQKVDKTRFDELAGTSEIVASGDNYVRYASGVQFCWGMASGDVDALKSLAKTVNFPQGFTSFPSVFVTSGSTSDNSSWIYNNVSAHQVENGKFELRLKNEENQAWTGLKVYWFAIGRWK